MRLTELRGALHRTPFKPFKISMADGREYPVPHRDFLLVHPAGRSAIIATMDDEFFEIVDIAMIFSLHFGNGRKTRQKKSKD